mgnify:CR=1 FL=1
MKALAPTVITLALLQGCATPESPSKEPRAADLTDPSGKACNVWIYRNYTHFRAYTLASDLPLARVDEADVGRLATGRSYCMSLPNGQHLLQIKLDASRIQTYLLNHPFEVVDGKPLYIRYAIEYGGLMGIGSPGYNAANSSFREVTEQEWKARE